MEVWKDVVNYKGLYKVSSLGRIKSYVRGKAKLLKLRDNNRGYLSVCLCDGKTQIRRTVHQLVAESFLNHKPCGYKIVIDHIDNNPLNNSVDNLQLISNRLNSSKDKKGTSKYTGVHKTKGGKWRSMIRINGKKQHLGVFKCETSAYLAYQLKLKSIT